MVIYIGVLLFFAYSYVALFAQLGVGESVWSSLFCSKAQLLPRWWLCVFCIQTNLSLWKTWCTVKHSAMLLSDYRDTFNSAMQAGKRTWNCALSAFWLQTGSWSCIGVSMRASRRPCSTAHQQWCKALPLVLIKLVWLALCMCIFISICIYSWVYLFPLMSREADFWWWTWLWKIHWNWIFLTRIEFIFILLIKHSTVFCLTLVANILKNCYYFLCIY